MPKKKTPEELEKDFETFMESDFGKPLFLTLS